MVSNSSFTQKQNNYDYLISIPGVWEIGDRSIYTKGRDSVCQDSVPTKENLFQIIKQLIESCFTDGIRSIPAFDITPNKVMSGQFKEKAPRGQLYDFTITPNGKLRYNEADAIRADSLGFPYWTFREDGRSQPNCEKGKRCKGGCIERGRECIVDLPPKFKQRLSQIQEMAIAVKSSIGESRFSTIEDAEAKIKDLPYEAAVIIDPKSNKILFEKKGQRDRIGFTEDEVKQVKGAVFTHNHPDLDFPPDTLAWQGAPFSTADIAFGSINEAAEIRAVGHLYSYSMKPPDKGWNKEFFEEKIVDSYNKHALNQYTGFVRDIQSGRTDAQSAQLEYMHRVTEEMSKELGIKYKRSKVPNIDEAKLKQEYRSRMRKKKLSKLAIAGALVAASVWAENQFQAPPTTTNTKTRRDAKRIRPKIIKCNPGFVQRGAACQKPRPKKSIAVGLLTAAIAGAGVAAITSRKTKNSNTQEPVTNKSPIQSDFPQSIVKQSSANKSRAKLLVGASVATAGVVGLTKLRKQELPKANISQKDIPHESSSPEEEPPKNAVEKAVRDAEETIRKNPYETIIMLDPNTGEKKLIIKGKTHNVDMDEEAWKTAKGKILTHNHPYNELMYETHNMGLGFSPSDMKVACIAEVAEIRAVTEGYRHSAKPPKEGWNERYYNETFKPVYDKYFKQTLREMQEEVRQGKVSASHNEEELCHVVMERSSKELNIEYSRTKIKGMSRRQVVKDRKARGLI